MKAVFTYLIFFCALSLTAQTSSEKLSAVIDTVQNYKSVDYDKYPMGLFSKAVFEEDSAFAKAQLKKLNAISSKSLTETESISLELLKFRLQETIDYFEYESFLNPLLSDSGFHTSWNYMVRPVANYDQAKSYLKRLNALPQVVDQYLPILREGLEKGVSQPRVIFEGFENSYNSQIVEDYTKSFYYEPFLNLPNSLSVKQKDSVLNAAKVAIEESVIPSFERVKTFFEKESLDSFSYDVTLY